MNKLFILLAVLFSTQCFSQSWIGYQVDPNANLQDVFFTSATVGYCVGSTNMVYKTTNGGAGWTPLSSNHQGMLYSICFTNQNTGYITGSQGDLVKTTNAGQSWQVSDITSGGTLYDITFINDNTGIACGYGIFKTTNAGVNWSQINNGLVGALHSVDFTPGNPSIMYCCGENGIIAKSIDYGNTWVQIPIGVNVYYECIDAFAPGQVIAVGEGVIRRTTNGGENWIVIPHSPANYFRDIQMVNASTGFACGFGGGEGRIYKTYNGGGNWYQLTYTAPFNLNGLYFVNETTGFFTRYDGDIIKTTNGGGSPIGINTISTEVPGEYSLEQNYPNPFNPVTNIEFSIQSPQFVTIQIYNSLGAEIKTLVNEQLAAGIYRADWDASAYASGIYFYTMKSGEYSNTKRMILIK